MPFLYPFISFYYRLNIAFVGHDPLQTLLTNACYLTLAPYPTSKPFNHLNSFCLTFSFSLTAKTIKGTSSIPFNHFNSFYLTFFFSYSLSQMNTKGTSSNLFRFLIGFVLVFLFLLYLQKQPQVPQQNTSNFFTSTFCLSLSVSLTVLFFFCLTCRKIYDRCVPHQPDR